MHADALLGETQRLSDVMSNWSEKTAPDNVQFVIRPKARTEPIKSDESARSGLVRVYHRLYGDYESYLSYIVTPQTEASQLLQQAIAQLSPSDDPRDYQLVLKSGTRGM